MQPTGDLCLDMGKEFKITHANKMAIWRVAGEALVKAGLTSVTLASTDERENYEVVPGTFAAVKAKDRVVRLNGFAALSGLRLPVDVEAQQHNDGSLSIEVCGVTIESHFGPVIYETLRDVMIKRSKSTTR